MKISLDLDGTVWDHMHYFREMMKTMLPQGIQVGILTGHSQESKDKDIELMVARGFPVPSFYYGKTPYEMQFNGAVSKSIKIKEEHIDMHYDDCDYANPETLRLFQELLGDQMYKLCIVHHREPRGVHFE